MSISSLTLPAAGGTSNNGDVRHPTSGALDGKTVSLATRDLAERDNQIAAAVNQLIAEVNNKEQSVALPLVRTSVPPSSSVVVTNFRIPAGYEVRILNGKISSTNNLVRLEVDWDATYGNDTGSENLVSTLDEASAGTEFKGTGELVVRLNNTGATTADAIPSVTVTQRPTGITGGGLVSPGSVGPQGIPGPQGIQGNAGTKGDTGAQGAPGIGPWKGQWDGSIFYNTNEVVKYKFAGSGFSSYIALTDGSAVTPPNPLDGSNAQWDLMAAAGDFSGNDGADGADGSKGDPGIPGINVRGVWSVSGSYVERDLVTYSESFGSGTVNRTFYADADIPVGVSPVISAGSNWFEFFGATQAPVYIVSNFSGEFITGDEFGEEYEQGVYPTTTKNPDAQLYASGTNSLGFIESSVEGAANTSSFQGVGFLASGGIVNFRGAARIVLPPPGGLTPTNAEWDNTNCFMVAAPNGTFDPESDGGGSIRVEKYGQRQFQLTVTNNEPIDVSITIVGYTGLQ